MKQEKPSLKDKLGRASPKWNFPLWYIPFMILLVWMWQGAFSQMTVRTVPYSEFKEYLNRGEVTEVSIKQDEITGTIVSKIEPAKAEPSSSPQSQKTNTAKAPPIVNATPKTFFFRAIPV